MLAKLIAVLIAGAAIWSFPQTQGLAIPFLLLALIVVFVVEGVRVVPQQSAWVVERLGKYSRTLEPGLNIIVPFFDRVAYKHSLKEDPLDVPEQTCITKDNTQLAVDGIIYYQVTDPRLASYGSSDYISAITQLAQTTLRSEVGKMELDKTFESRDLINHQVVAVLDEAGRTWGVKVLRYEIKNLTPPAAILHSMQAQITAEREKRALAKLEIPFVRAKVGDRYVLELLQEKNWNWGAENSGHIICRDKHTTGDGIVAALQVLSALASVKSTLKKYTAELTLYPQILINIKTQKGFDYRGDPRILDSVAAAEADLDGRGRVLLRPSGTEPVLRVMVEGQDESRVKNWAERIVETVRSAVSE